MLDFRQVGGRTDLRQFCRPPAVYLDHWAFRRFSDEPALRKELVSTITERNGTLAIGRLNLLEFTRVEHPEQVRAAEELVQAVLPRVFFLDIQIMDVVQRESARGFGACGDMQMFEYYGRPLLDDAQRWRASDFSFVGKPGLLSLSFSFDHVDGFYFGSSASFSTPEPGTLGLMAAGLVGILGLFKKRKRPALSA